MKAIQPINLWVDGDSKQATRLTLTISFDNLATEAVFKYTLSDGDNNALITGLLPIDGDAYQTWGQSTDANTDAYVFAASKLNLILV